MALFKENDALCLLCIMKTLKDVSSGLGETIS